MTVEDCAVFRSDIPSDSLEDDHDILEFGGRNLAELITTMLVRRGYSVEPPLYGELDGWMLNIRKNGRRYWLRISEIDQVHRYLVSFDVSWFWRRRRVRYVEFLRGIDTDLRADGRFHDVVWFVGGQDPYAFIPPEEGAGAR